MAFSKPCFAALPGWRGVIITVAAVGIAIVVSCTSKVPASETIVRDGLLFEKGAQTPFSGIVVGKGREGYRREVCRYEKSYENGLLNGRSQYWYEDGTLESIVPYKDGEMHGVVTRYHPNGKIKARIHFENGFRGGSKGEFFWDEEGNVIKG